MRLFRLLFACALAASVAACGEDEDAIGPQPPIAGLRYVNAVPDTGAQDFRVIDVVQDAPQQLQLAFRSFGPGTGYTAVQAGNRRIRVFPNSTDPAQASKILVDTTFNFEADRNYSFIHLGALRSTPAQASRLLIIQDAPPQLSATQVAVRVIHAAVGTGNVDVYVRPQGSAAGGPPAISPPPTFANVAYRQVTNYVTRAPATAVDTSLQAAVTDPGQTTVLFSGNAPAGVAGDATVNPIPGGRIGGTALTALVLPASVMGSQAPSFPARGVIFLVDRRPPNTVP